MREDSLQNCHGPALKLMTIHTKKVVYKLEFWLSKAIFLTKVEHWSRAPDSCCPHLRQTLVQGARVTFQSSQTTSQHPAIKFKSAAGDLKPRHMHGAGRIPCVSCGLCGGVVFRGWKPWVILGNRERHFLHWLSDPDGQSRRLVPAEELRSHLLRSPLDNCPLNAVYRTWFKITSKPKGGLTISARPFCRTSDFLQIAIRLCCCKATFSIFLCKAVQLKGFHSALLILEGELRMTRTCHNQNSV